MVTSTPELDASLPAADVRDRLLRRVERRIERLLTEERARWSAVAPAAAGLVDTVQALIDAGGKRLRPAFCIAGFLAAGGDPGDERVIDAAAAIEMLHVFALLHDDVMDDAALRRGIPTAHTVHMAEHRRQRWRGESRRYGESTAMLAGDLAMSYAVRFAASLPPAAREVWDTLTTEMIVGQFLDLSVAATSSVDLTLCRWIAVGKSGAYSIFRPMTLGSAVAGHGGLGAVFRDYGTALGEAFQLRDDLIDAYGDSAVTGKPNGHDLEQHKMTMLLVLAVSKDQRVRDIVTAGEWDGPELRRLLDECDIRADVEARIDELVEAARSALSGLHHAPAWRDELTAMAVRAAYRDR